MNVGDVANVGGLEVARTIGAACGQAPSRPDAALPPQDKPAPRVASHHLAMPSALPRILTFDFESALKAFESDEVPLRWARPRFVVSTAHRRPLPRQIEIP